MWTKHRVHELYKQSVLLLNVKSSRRGLPGREQKWTLSTRPLTIISLFNSIVNILFHKFLNVFVSIPSVA